MSLFPSTGSAAGFCFSDVTWQSAHPLQTAADVTCDLICELLILLSAPTYPLNHFTNTPLGREADSPTDTLNLNLSGPLTHCLHRGCCATRWGRYNNRRGINGRSESSKSKLFMLLLQGSTMYVVHILFSWILWLKRVAPPRLLTCSSPNDESKPAP